MATDFNKLNAIVNQLNDLDQDALRSLNREVVSRIREHRAEVKAEFRPRQLVQFFDKKRYITVQGRITKINSVNIKMQTVNGLVYTVSPELLKEWDGVLPNGKKWDGLAAKPAPFSF